MKRWKRINRLLAVSLCLLFAILQPLEAAAATVVKQDGRHTDSTAESRYAALDTGHRTIFGVNLDAIGFAGEEWWVIGQNGTGIHSQSETMTLLSKEILFNSEFDTDANRSDTANNQYGGSLLQKRMKEFYNGGSSPILPQERRLILSRELDGVRLDNGTDGTLVGDHFVWPLSSDEAGSLSGNISGTAPWRLRSPFGSADAEADIVNFKNGPFRYLDLLIGCRPALTLNLDSVFFMTDAIDGKPNVGSGLHPFSTPSGTIKFTMKDDANLSLNVVSNDPVTVLVGDKVDIAYTGAATGPGRCVSVMVVDRATDEPMYYGRMVDCAAGNADGTVHFQIPSSFAAGEYKLLLFNEQVDGDNYTDFASTPIEIDLTVNARPGSPLKNITVNDSVIGYGGYEWWVIGHDGHDGDGVNSQSGTMTLLSKDNLFITEFDTGANRGGTANNQYSGSLLQQKMEEFYDGGGSPLLSQERDLILPWELDFVRLAGGTEGILIGDHFVWPLSAAEASVLPENTIRQNDSIWWLRVPFPANDFMAGAVDGTGYIGTSDVTKPRGGRPALTLSMDSVLFTSAATGGKASVGSGLQTYSIPVGAIKLTVRDDTNLSVDVSTAGPVRAEIGGMASFVYDRAQTGPGHSVSVLIADKTTGDLLYYGRPGDCETSGRGTASFRLPDNLAEGEYKLLVFNEQVNGDNVTDFASTPVELVLQVEKKSAYPIMPVVYPLTIQAGTGGRIVQGTSGNYAPGAAISIEAMADPDYVFEGWTSTGGGSFASAESPGTTFTMSANTVTITANFRYTGDGSDSSYTWKTLEDASGVRVSGSFTEDAKLKVKEQQLHPEDTCTVCDDIRERQNRGELLVLYDISLASGRYRGDLEVEIPVGKKYNGQTVIFLHCKEKVLESRKATVKKGIVKGTFSSLSPYAVAEMTEKTVIAGLPESCTLQPGRSITWKPTPPGGSWDYDKDLLKMTEDGGRCTFKAIKRGKTDAVYTVDGVSFTVSITITSPAIPQTGDAGNMLLWMLLMMVSLPGFGALLIYKKKYKEIK
ncbi:InlB B-repeat-containing protein [Anaerolentibacter hominis]|uniref:InlB B-repeat-containing protein n=1 Tax=Anaerolentibacter hominis TaxID=3079009 RepID=UPI0031B86DC4